MGKTIDIGGRIHNPEVGNVVTGANEILDDTKNKKQDVINSEVDAALEALDANKQDNLTFDQTPTESSTNPVTSGGVYAADLALQQAIEAILTLIPSAASALNQLADKSFVNSSIATASATFRGTYNLVSDLHLSVTASHQDIATALASAVSTADNNDYCFVQIPTSDTSSDIRVTERYKFDGTAWAYEYDLNNSGFTATQWEAINSGITALLVTKLGALPTAAELATSLAGKQNVLTFDNVPVSGSDNPVKSGGLYQLFTAIDAKFPSDASSSNKLVAENRLAAYVTAVIEALDASFDLTSADGHVTFRMTQTNGVIASVQILTSDIASASALTTLGGRVSKNETDIANLQAAYAGLTQSDIIVGTLPSSGQQQNKIYRQPDQDHTPPQFYSDYMWNGSNWVLMATYNNAIDDEPTAGSNNLVKSGGVDSCNRGVLTSLFCVNTELIPSSRTPINDYVTGLLMSNGNVYSGQSNHRTYSYTNSGNSEVYVDTGIPSPFGGYYYKNIAIFTGATLVYVDKFATSRIVRLLPGYTLKVSCSVSETRLPSVVSYELFGQEKDYLLQLLRKIESYRNAEVLNIYYDNGWKIKTNQCNIYPTEISRYEWIQLAEEIINTSVGSSTSSDIYATWYYLTFNPSTSKFDLYGASGIAAALADRNIIIVGYGNLNNYGKDFITTFPIQVNGRSLYKNISAIPSGIDMLALCKQRILTYGNNPLLDIYYDSGNWKIDVFYTALKLVNKENGEIISPYWIRPTEETLTMDLAYTSNDPNSYMYYLLFDISTLKPKLVTQVEISSAFTDSNVLLIGYGNLGTNINYCTNFECTVPIKIWHLNIGRNSYDEKEYSALSKKKVLWLGTSIPAGSTYAVNSCKALGRTCINNAQGSSYINRRYTPQTLRFVPSLDFSLSQSIAEYEENYRTYVTQGLLTEETLDFWKSMSYEYRILPYLDEIDTIVFDHGYNDADKIDEEIDNPDWDSLDKTTYIGAFNFLMKEIFKRKPYMKIIIVTYFQNKTVDKQQTMQTILNHIEMNEKIAERFGYPILKPYLFCPFDGYFVPDTDTFISDYNTVHGTSYEQYWQDTDGNVKRFQMYCLDGVHPRGSETDLYLDNVYTHMLQGLI